MGVTTDSKKHLGKGRFRLIFAQNSYYQYFTLKMPLFLPRFITASFPNLQGTNSVICTIYVQYLYNICTFTIVHILYKYCTYIVQRPELVRPGRGVLTSKIAPVFKFFFLIQKYVVFLHLQTDSKVCRKKAHFRLIPIV